MFKVFSWCNQQCDLFRIKQQHEQLQAKVEFALVQEEIIEESLRENNIQKLFKQIDYLKNRQNQILEQDQVRVDTITKDLST